MQAKKVTCHIYIERIPMDKVEATPEYLQKLFQEKDILQDSFHTYGNFTESRKLAPLKAIKLKPRACVLYNNLAWMSFNLSILLYIAYSLLAQGQFITFTAVFGSIISLCMSQLNNYFIVLIIIQIFFYIFSLLYDTENVECFQRCKGISLWQNKVIHF